MTHVDDKNGLGTQVSSFEDPHTVESKSKEELCSGINGLGDGVKVRYYHVTPTTVLTQTYKSCMKSKTGCVSRRSRADTNILVMKSK